MTSYVKAEKHNMSVDKTAGEDTGVLEDVFASGRDRGADSAAPEPVEKEPPKSEAKAPEPEPKSKDTGESEKAEADDGSSKQYRDPETGRFVPLTELKSERQKRQEEARLRSEAERRAIAAEAELNATRRMMEQFSSQRQQPQQQFQEPQEPDPTIDAHAWAKYTREKMLAELNQRDYQTRVYASEAVARSKYADYDQVSKVFMEAAAANPQLRQAAINAPWPAEYAYQAGKRIMFDQKIGSDPDAYEKRIREEERKRVMDEMRAGTPQPRFPGTLADAPAAGAQGQVLTDTAMAQDIFSSSRKRRSG